MRINALRFGRETVNTRIGKIRIQNGYPSDDSIAKLYDELDFQRAVQAYIWAMPTVALDAVRIAYKRDFGVDYNEVVLVDKFASPELLALTANSTTVYGTAFVDLGRDGPIVIDSPAEVYGVIDDYWQRPILEIGPFGPDRGMGGKFLILPPSYEGNLPAGYLVARSPTHRAMYVGRGIVKQGNLQRAVDTLSKIRIYPLSRANNPPDTHIFKTGDKPMNSIAPRGFEYWEHLAGIINQEPVEARDRFFYAMLLPLGIEKHKAFNPDNRQRQILSDAAELGFLMAQAISMAPRFENAPVYPDTHWEWVLTLSPDQEAENYSQLDERTDYTFEAITVAAGMIKPIVGAGSQYMSAAKDKDGEWLEGGKTYRLHVPRDVPVNDFWSITVYDNQTRSMIQTDTNKAALSSYDALKTNADGSIDIFFGPAAPKGFEANFIKTTRNKGWFSYFRLYAPTEAFFDKSWRLPDVEKIKGAR